MHVTSLAPMLQTWDLPGSIAFYRDVLGFEVAAHSEEYGWAALVCGAAEVMLSRPSGCSVADGPAFTGSLYFRIRGVDALWERLKDSVRVSYPIETFHYGMREFAILDNNGYMLQFGEPISDEMPETSRDLAGRCDNCR